jgi:hypothetical protein
MKQHKLIFDYLDGEISSEDNKILREILNEDEELQKDFQNFVDINFEMKNDNENFIFPEEFLDSVGNSIVGRMQEDKKLLEQKEKRKKLFFQYSLVATFLIISGLILNFYRINTPSFSFDKNYSNQSTEKLPLMLKSDKIAQSNDNSSLRKTPLKAMFNSNNFHQSNNKSVFSNKLISQDNIYDEKNVASSKDAQISSNSSNNQIQDNGNNANFTKEITGNNENDNISTNSLNNTDENKIIESNFSFNSFNAQNKLIENKNINFNQNLQNNLNQTSILSEINEKENPYFDASSFSNHIFPNSHINTIVASNKHLDLNSFFGYDLIAFGVTKKNQIINSFTQSVGAEIDNYSKIGLETGFMQYIISEDKYIMITKENSGGTLIKIENSDDKSILVRVSGSSITNKDLLWAGVYYERSMINFDNFILSSRISIGASDYGLMSSLKLIAKYRIAKSIDLTIGSDAKLFSGNGANSTTKSNLNSTISLIYGLRFAF